MTKIVITAESGSDIPVEFGREQGIYVVPMHVTFGSVTKDDGYFPSEDVCSFYEKTKILPKTSGCNPSDFSKVFDEIHAKEPDAQILHLAYSAVTTCSYNSAKIAAEGRDYVTFVDTKSVAAAQYAIVLTMNQRIREHPAWSVQDAAREAEKLSARARMGFTTKDLEYLRAGGRVSNAVAIAGKILAMHPKIEILDGKLIATKMYRGTMKSVIRKLTRDFITVNHLQKEELWLIRTPEFTEELKDTAESVCHELGYDNITWVKSGGVITTHSGPSSYGVVGFAE